ncbi:MAG TPA: hypothetical protein EYH30_03985 [Anaerolineales bacterium]|nr:hypothetical protein [Anaerolineales bacterium]
MKHLVRLCGALAILLTTAPFLTTPTASAAPGPWWADYFPNPNLKGAPVLSRMDSVVSFDWGLGSPEAAIPADNFSVRWTREEWFAGGTYRFLFRSDDGIRVWVGDELVLDEWHDRQAIWTWVDRYVPEGIHPVTIEYYEHTGAAVVQVGWEKVAGGATWRAEYYDNQNLDSDPVLIRNDQAIDFDWGAGSPDPAVPADGFSARWTRVLGFTAGTYRFLASCDDGVRIHVDGQTVVDAWQKQELPNTRTGEIALAEGQHTIVVEYFEQGGEAAAHVWWERREPAFGWHGLYYDNPNLVGGPALVRDDAEINFDWGVGPPVDWMPDDNFSVRWSRTVTFDPGYYVFKVQSDDGMRLWLDGGLVMNKWRPMEGELHYLDGVYLEGPHELVVEYFEQTGHARIHFWWDRSTPWGVLPHASDPTLDPWHTEFFANPNLEGPPVLTRVDTALDYDWGLGAPAPGLPADGFSVRWTQPLIFDAGTYRFVTTTDDGVRLWVDDRLLINAWRPMRSTRTATLWLEEGVHQIRMEYFERRGAAMARLTWHRIVQPPSHPATQPSSLPRGPTPR